MPTVLKIASFRFHFYSDEGNEPSHIHVATSDGECKFWLDPIKLARNKNLRPREIKEIERLVFEHGEYLICVSVLSPKFSNQKIIVRLCERRIDRGRGEAIWILK
jgi:hypothetical protein